MQGWGRKPRQVSGDGTLSEFLEYLEYFIEARGRITAPEEGEEDTPVTLQMELGQTPGSQQPEDAVRLLTVHAAKGLEFPVVFVLRVTQPSFPSSYREDLVEFPDELRDPDSRPEDDPKTVHEQEELRLFYVALTRAEDLLVLCAKKGTGKKDPTPPGYLRELVVAGARTLKGCVEFGLVPSSEVIPAIHAGAEPLSRIAEWVKLPPLPQTTNRKLSASAIERYERCPLSYKLGLEWKLPEEPAANSAVRIGDAFGAAGALRRGAQRASHDADEVVRLLPRRVRENEDRRPNPAPSCMSARPAPVESLSGVARRPTARSRRPAGASVQLRSGGNSA